MLFQNLTFSGIALLIVNGLTNLTAAWLLVKKRCGGVLGGVFSVTLMLWIGIQLYVFPSSFMSMICLVFGAAREMERAARHTAHAPSQR